MKTIVLKKKNVDEKERKKRIENEKGNETEVNLFVMIRTTEGLRMRRSSQCLKLRGLNEEGGNDVKRRRGVDEYKEGSEEEVKVQDVYNETP
jgi:hypothetical protein